MKPRRDITLGEMQDECKKYWNNGDFGYCGKCQYMSVCCHYERYCPAQLNLTDPPRFTEAQMALLKALWGLGGKTVMPSHHSKNDSVIYIYNEVGGNIAILSKSMFWGKEEPEEIDLAELFGKEGK